MPNFFQDPIGHFRSWLKDVDRNYREYTDVASGHGVYDANGHFKGIGNPIGKRGEPLGIGPVGETGQYLFGDSYLSPVPLMIEQSQKSDYSPASSGGTGVGSGTWITGNTNSGESTYEDSAEVPEDIYGEWTPYLEYLRQMSEEKHQERQVHGAAIWFT